MYESGTEEKQDMSKIDVKFFADKEVFHSRINKEEQRFLERKIDAATILDAISPAILHVKTEKVFYCDSISSSKSAA